MLVVSKERYRPSMLNTIVLFKDHWYYYVHRSVYDQTVLLADQFGSAEELAELVGGTPVNREAADWFYEHAPAPLRILAPFLLLVEEELEQDMEMCCGALHVITSMIHVKHFIQKPLEIRKSVLFSSAVKEEYEMMWESFFLSAIPRERAEPSPSLQAPLPDSMETEQLFRPRDSCGSAGRGAQGDAMHREATEAEKAATRNLLR
ncbi:hypothetical protein [Cohnella fermenti]|uniref:Uncharacterized protein n=1 Tax=Cohnella fermenti TaxID=2565925 RepID=A0A4S4BHA0_9BACL|nr:hypothetical protein [Cohnella fermenti]THF73916.1 hypothetical protein E6C55_26975 [Cohnella fermenti]